MTERRRSARRRFGAPPAMPPVVVAAAVSAALLLGRAWWEVRPAAMGSDEAKQPILTVEIPSDHRARLRSWEAFFVCYDLVEEDEIIGLTMKRHYRGGKGSLDFPLDGRVEVELPQGGPINISSDVLRAEIERVKRAVHLQRAELRRQCSGT